MKLIHLIIIVFVLVLYGLAIEGISTQRRRNERWTNACIARGGVPAMGDLCLDPKATK